MMKEIKTNYYVYRIYDPITKEFYIGSRCCKCTIEDDKYMGSYRTWNPIEKPRLIKSILKWDFIDRNSAYAYEANIIKENIDNPLNRNYHIPVIGFRMDGVIVSEYTRKKISEAGKNRVVTNDTRNKISKTKRGIPNRIDSNEKNRNAHLGKTHTVEAKQKISKSLIGNARALGMKHTDETKRKCAVAIGKRWVTDGIISKYIDSESPIPYGFRYGKTYKK